MVLILKRGGILFLGSILIVTFLIWNLRSTVPAAVVEKGTVVVDAGHGAPDGGAVGTKTGVQEKDLNLAVATLLQAQLSENGVSVQMTRTGDEGLHTAQSKTMREKKRTDMAARVRIANQTGVSALVSIHMNRFTNATYSGPQIFYAADTPKSLELADCIRTSILEIVGAHCTREIKPIKNELYLLHNAKVPAVIVECGFLSNAKEEQLLCDPTYQASMAHAIAEGILTFKNTYK